MHIFILKCHTPLHVYVYMFAYVHRKWYIKREAFKKNVNIGVEIVKLSSVTRLHSLRYCL